MSRFAHLHLHTQYSILDGAIPISALVDRCAELGMPAVAMTDHGNMFGAIEFQQQCRRAGIKPIIGCEVYVAQGSRFEKDASTGFDGINHMILLAMDERGYLNLTKLVSRGYLEGFYRKPRVDLELLRECHEGLIATSGCLSGAIPTAITSGNRDEAWRLVETYARIFQDRFYLELQRHGIPAQEQVNRELLGMQRDLGLPLLATNDCHYLGCNDAHAHAALLCVQTGKTLDDPNRFQFPCEGFYVKDADEMLEVFHDCPDAVTNSVELAERCNFELETGQALLPDFQVPGGESAESYLRRLVEDGLRERLGLDPDEPFDARHAAHSERAKYELEVIIGKGYAGYFLIVWDMMRFARERGIPVGTRGSAAGSLAGYALHIADVDPIEYGIPFERFLNPERPSMPDVDIDFCMNRRGEVLRYVEEKYNGEGEEGRRVAGIVTFGTMQAKAAVRDCGRVLGIPFADVDRVAKLIPDTLGIKLSDALAQSRELRELRERQPQVNELIELALSLEGQIRNPGRHPGGIVISSRPLIDVAPLYRDQRSKEVVVQFDVRASEELGLVKFDLLGLRTLTIIHDVVTRVRATRDSDFDIAKTDHADPLTYELLCRAETHGIFQVESDGCSKLVYRLQPKHLRDLIPILALYRPGPLQSGMVDEFVDVRHGRRQAAYLLPELEEVLAETYGVILYQDQVLLIANRIAGYTLGEGDLLRKAMGKKIPDEMEKQRAKFVEGCVAKGHPRDKANQLFDLIFEFSGYGFGKAHAVAYAQLTHRTAYLKAHFPAEFYAACMSVEWRDQAKLDGHVRDAAGRDIAILPPDVNESLAEFSVADRGSAVRYGLVGVKNVGEGAVEAILEERARSGRFESLFDFCSRIDMRKVNRRVIESLIRCGAFDFTKASRASLWEALPAALERGQRDQRDRELGQGSLFAELGPSSAPTLPEVPEWSRDQLLDAEKELLGFYLTGHPLAEQRATLERFSAYPLDAIPEHAARQDVWLGGLVSGVRTQKTRRGDLMARARLEDLSGTINTVFFPECYEKSAPLLRSEKAVLLKGTLAGEGERLELQVEEAIPLGEAWSRCTGRLSLRVAAEAATPERLGELRKVLDLVPGGVPVTLEVVLPGGAEAVLHLPRHQVAVSPDLVTRIDGLFQTPVALCCAS